jgi:hypothetical protein
VQRIDVDLVIAPQIAQAAKERVAVSRHRDITARSGQGGARDVAYRVAQSDIVVTFFDHRAQMQARHGKPPNGGFRLNGFRRVLEWVWARPRGALCQRRRAGLIERLAFPLLLDFRIEHGPSVIAETRDPGQQQDRFHDAQRMKPDADCHRTHFDPPLLIGPHKAEKRFSACDRRAEPVRFAVSPLWRTCRALSSLKRWREICNRNVCRRSGGRRKKHAIFAKTLFWISGGDPLPHGSSDHAGR